MKSVLLKVAIIENRCIFDKYFKRKSCKSLSQTLITKFDAKNINFYNEIIL